MTRWLLLGLFLTSGCVAHAVRTIRPMCLLVEPPTPLGWYCYPVDVHSGQQMCVRQVFNNQDNGGW